MGVPVKLVYKSCCLVPYELSWSRIARQQWIVMQKNIQNGKVLLFRIWVVPKFVGPRVLPNRLNTRKSGHACAVLSCGGVYVYELAASACARIYISVIELTAFGTRHWVASHRIASHRLHRTHAAAEAVDDWCVPRHLSRRDCDISCASRIELHDPGHETKVKHSSCGYLYTVTAK